MNNNGNGTEKASWLEVRDTSGKLLFKYNPIRNEIELKPKGSDAYMIIRLDEIRLKHGYTPVDLNIVFVREYIATEVVLETSTQPYSNNKK